MRNIADFAILLRGMKNESVRGLRNFFDAPRPTRPLSRITSTWSSRHLLGLNDRQPTSQTGVNADRHGEMPNHVDIAGRPTALGKENTRRIERQDCEANRFVSRRDPAPIGDLKFCPARVSGEARPPVDSVSASRWSTAHSARGATRDRPTVGRIPCPSYTRSR